MERFWIGLPLIGGLFRHIQLDPSFKVVCLADSTPNPSFGQSGEVVSSGFYDSYPTLYISHAVWMLASM